MRYGAASSPTVRSRAASCLSMPRRVPSPSARKTRSSRGYSTMWLSINRPERLSTTWLNDISRNLCRRRPPIDPFSGAPRFISFHHDACGIDLRSLLLRMISHTRRRILLVCLSLGVAVGACMEVTAIPSGSERFDAPPEYRLWWSMVESCSGLTGSLANVEWLVVPGSTSIGVGNGDYSGYWFEQGNRIVLAANAQTEGTLVRHEMLHALTRGGHTRNEFLERCGGIVNCETSCIRRSGTAAECSRRCSARLADDTRRRSRGPARNTRQRSVRRLFRRDRHGAQFCYARRHGAAAAER